MCIDDRLHTCMCAMRMPGAWSPHYLEIELQFAKSLQVDAGN